MKNETGREVRVLVAGGSGHSVWVFDEWEKDNAPVCLVGAVQTLPEESLDFPLKHSWAKKFTPNIYTDIQQALENEKPDMVVVSTRPDLNAELIEACLNSGCHVIAEKPVTTCRESLVRIHSLVKQTGKYVLPMLGMHNFPQMVQAKSIVERGLIGVPTLVNARKSYQWGNRADWFNNRDLYGGVWGWVGIHSFNHSSYILGKNATEVVAAQERNAFHPNFPGCSDCLTGLFMLEGDVQMTVSIDLLRPDGQKEWGDDWIRIVGSEGSLEANPGLGTLRLIRKGEEESYPECDVEAESFYTAFLDAVLNPDADFSSETSLGFQLTDSALSANEASYKSMSHMKIDPRIWEL